jgi:hypothetical protein
MQAYTAGYICGRAYTLVPWGRGFYAVYAVIPADMKR